MRLEIAAETAKPQKLERMAVANNQIDTWGSCNRPFYIRTAVPRCRPNSAPSHIKLGR
jgi:hypothetical protein